MQIVSEQFTTYANGPMRPIRYKLLMSFDKSYDAATTFFTIEQSLIGGSDIIKGAGDVIQEWDKYQYKDYTDRIMSIEWSRQVEPISSVTYSIADIVLDNHDDYFTPGSSSEIASNILPQRPVRIYGGFGQEMISQFVGITSKMPKIDERSKTATFHCVDFLYSLFGRPLLESAMLVGVTTDQAITTLFEVAGLTSSQLDFDNGLSAVGFAYFERGNILGDAIRQIMRVELGRIYMNEDGVITFRNRANYSNVIQQKLNAHQHILSAKNGGEDDLINVVEITSHIREVQPNQSYWELTGYIEVPANSSLDVWANFQDPVITIDTPQHYLSATTSSYKINTANDGSGSDSTGVTLTDDTQFSKTYKMTFTNNTGATLYIVSLIIYATPAVVIEDVFVREQDDDSVNKYDEHKVTINNDFYESGDDAKGKAQLIVMQYAEPISINEVTVKGNFALQLDDVIELTLFDRVSTYKITKIANKIDGGRYTQTLSLKNFTPANFFTIGLSLIAGTDAISP